MREKQKKGIHGRLKKEEISRERDEYERRVEIDDRGEEETRKEGEAVVMNVWKVERGRKKQGEE